MRNFKYDLNDPNILNVYQYGSRVYGSHNENSDYDYILVVSEHFEVDDIDYHVFTKEAFQMAINEHDISVLECFFIPEEFKLKETVTFEFKLDKQKLRKSISTIVNNSYVKAKKKLIVVGDYDLNAGIKSFFHSYRILNLGVQIALKNKIYDYSCCNWLLTDLQKLSRQYERNLLWDIIETKYKEQHKTKKHRFKMLCPKESKQFNKQVLNKWFSENDLSYMSDKQFEKFTNEIIKKYLI